MFVPFVLLLNHLARGVWRQHERRQAGMGIGHHDLPKDGMGGNAAGSWHVCMSSPINARMGGVHLVQGLTATPINGMKLRRLVSAMGNSICWARREEDGYHAGEPRDAASTARERIEAAFALAVELGVIEEAEAEEQIAEMIAGMPEDPDEVEAGLLEMEASIAELAAGADTPSAEPAETDALPPAELAAMDRDQLREFARENELEVDLRLGEDNLRVAIEAALAL